MKKFRSTFKSCSHILLRHLLFRTWDISIAINRALFLRYLQKHQTDVIARRLNNPGMFSWDEGQIPGQLKDFGDLTFLFWLTPLNRGLLRQDFDEASALYQTVSSISNATGVEIGRFYGASTVLLALAVGSNGKVISIDIAPKNDADVREVLKRFNFEDRVELVVGDANDVDVGSPLDFVFIDGDHSYEGAKRDHNRWGQQVKTGGYIIHHDMANARPYATQWQSLAKLRQEILINQDGQLELTDEVGSMSIFRKISDNFTEI